MPQRLPRAGAQPVGEGGEGAGGEAMTAHRSEVIREVENDLIAARARGMIRTPKFAGQTYQQVKAERAKWRRLTLRVAGWALFVMVAFAFAVHLVLKG